MNHHKGLTWCSLIPLNHDAGLLYCDLCLVEFGSWGMTHFLHREGRKCHAIPVDSKIIINNHVNHVSYVEPPLPVRVPKHWTNGSPLVFPKWWVFGDSYTTHLGVYHLDPTATPRTLQPKLHGVFGHLIKEFLRQNLYSSKKRSIWPSYKINQPWFPWNKGISHHLGWGRVRSL